MTLKEAYEIQRKEVISLRRENKKLRQGTYVDAEKAALKKRSVISNGKIKICCVSQKNIILSGDTLWNSHPSLQSKPDPYERPEK